MVGLGCGGERRWEGRWLNKKKSGFGQRERDRGWGFFGEDNGFGVKKLVMFQFVSCLESGEAAMQLGFFVF